MRQKNEGTVNIDGITLKPDPKSPTGNYVATFKLGGRVRRVGCGCSSEHEAFRVAKKKRKKLKKLVKGAKGKQAISVSKACTNFLIECEYSDVIADGTYKMLATMTHRIQGYVVDHVTGERRNRTRNGMFVPHLYSSTDQPLHKIDQSEFEDYLGEMRDVYAHGTLRVFITRIDKMMSWCKEVGYAVPEVDWKRYNKQLPESPLKSRPFTENEVELVLDWLKNSKRSKHNYYKLLIALECGFRIAEICSLKIADIDIFDAGVIWVVRGKKRKKARTPVSMTSRLKKELGHCIKALPKEQIYLFPSMCGTTHCKPGSQWFRDCLKALDINSNDGMERLVLHSARSRYITLQLQENQNLFKVQQSVQIVSPLTLQRYNRLLESESSKEAAAVLDSVAARRAEAKRKYDEEMALIDQQLSGLDD